MNTQTAGQRERATNQTTQPSEVTVRLGRWVYSLLSSDLLIDLEQQSGTATSLPSWVFDAPGGKSAEQISAHFQEQLVKWRVGYESILRESLGYEAEGGRGQNWHQRLRDAVARRDDPPPRLRFSVFLFEASALELPDESELQELHETTFRMILAGELPCEAVVKGPKPTDQARLKTVVEALDLVPLKYPPVRSEVRKAGRPVTTARLLDAEPFLDVKLPGLEEQLDELHKPILNRFQELLDQLKDQAAPTFEENHRVATEVMRLAERYGVELVFEKDGLRSAVRVRCVNEGDRGIGHFFIRASAGGKHICKSMTWPALRAEPAKIEKPDATY
jgi:regulator of replication initiation timing